MSKLQMLWNKKILTLLLNTESADHSGGLITFQEFILFLVKYDFIINNTSPETKILKRDFSPRGELFFKNSYGARYLDPKYSRWISTDPALGEYIPAAGKSSEADKLPGMGGIYNSVNGNLYHYAGNNPVRYVDPDGNWINNCDGTFTAEKGDTLWGLQVETGRSWKSSDFKGDPKLLQIGQVVSFNPTNIKTITVDSTEEALALYFYGNGIPVNLGEKTINTLKNSPEHIYNQEALKNGTATSETHRYGVNLENYDNTFHVGDTVVTYEKSEGTKYRVITFRAFVDDGFWDVLSGKDGDRTGPKKELPGGKPYSYIPYSWTEVYNIIPMETN